MCIRDRIESGDSVAIAKAEQAAVAAQAHAELAAAIVHNEHLWGTIPVQQDQTPAENEQSVLFQSRATSSVQGCDPVLPSTLAANETNHDAAENACDLSLAADALAFAEKKSEEAEELQRQLHAALKKIEAQAATIAGLGAELTSVKAENIELRRAVLCDSDAAPAFCTPKPMTPSIRSKLGRTAAAAFNLSNVQQSLLTPKQSTPQSSRLAAGQPPVSTPLRRPGEPTAMTQTDKACSLAQICKKIAALDKKLEEVKGSTPEQSHALLKQLTQERTQFVEAKRNLTALAMMGSTQNA
eukprot:TRINITY_DN10023_c0_g1_i3.p1 TRINITY_DN10023_c0_g1~~TRINITY_DN10023_c0_g1_i3.p1  ORF type:complete len:298 (-),score=86.19 TRINITY_DN10023_c0_g1_i3:197-1090(-)